MTSSTGPGVDDSLKDTLLLALTKCQEQTRQLVEQSKTIDDLRQQNQRLKEELEAFKKKSTSELETKYASQFQNIFERMAEKQGEIDRLKTKLHNVKLKVRNRGLTEPTSSSPNVSSANGEPHSTRVLPVTPSPSSLNREHNDSRYLRGKQTLHTCDQEVLSKKRARTLSPIRQPLGEVSANANSTILKGSRTGSVKSTKTMDKDLGISELAEDGEDYPSKKQRHGAQKKPKPLAESVYHRLGDLMGSRAPATPSLSRARSTSPSVGKQAKHTATPASAVSEPLGLPTPNSEFRSKKKRPASASPGETLIISPEDDEPFRSRPVNRLGLKHFRLNPTTNSGVDFAYNEVVRGQQRKCFPGCTRECCVGTFRMIAESMPGFQGSAGRPLTDSEILLDYLGQGSEERIRTLTPKARENLIHDARTKLVANAYGKMHRDAHQRGKSPPGFWRTDMPGSQELRTDHEAANFAEREEILRRFNDAIKGGGRWIFADE